MLCGKSLTQKTAYSTIPFIWRSRTGKTNLWWKIIRIIISYGVKEGIYWDGTKKTVLYPDSNPEVWVAQVHTFVRTHKFVYFCIFVLNFTYFIVCKFYLKRKKYWTLLNDMHAEVFGRKYVHVCNIRRNT